MGAGVAAIFRARLAGTLFAAEILYCSPEFEAEVILPTGLASVLSYCTFGVLAGGHCPTVAPSLLHADLACLHQCLGAVALLDPRDLGRRAGHDLRPFL